MLWQSELTEFFSQNLPSLPQNSARLTDFWGKLGEFWAKNSVSSLCHRNNRLRGTHWVRSLELSESVAKRTHRVFFPELTEFAPKLSLELSEFSPPKQSSRNSIPLPFPSGAKEEMVRDKFLHRGFCTSRTRFRPEFWETNFGRPNFGPEFLGQIFWLCFSSKRGPKFWETNFGRPNSWVEFFDSVFSTKEAPSKMGRSFLLTARSFLLTVGLCCLR